MTEFDIGSILEIRGKVYVMAQRRDDTAFELHDDSTLGTVPIETWMDVPLVKSDDGTLQTNVFAFVLRNPGDQGKLAKGDHVYLERGSNQGAYACGRCGADWNLRNDIPPTTRARIARLSEASRVDAIREFRRGQGCGLATAKAVVVHVAAPGGVCHRCGETLPKGTSVECKTCKSFNYNWG